MNKNLDRYMPGVGRSRRGFSFELTGSCAAIRRLRGILPALTLDSLDGRGTHSGIMVPERAGYLGKFAGEFQLQEKYESRLICGNVNCTNPLISQTYSADFFTNLLSYN